MRVPIRTCACPSAGAIVALLCLSTGAGLAQRESFQHFGQEAGLENLAVNCLAQDRTGLALVGGHAERGVTLQVLERAEALARRDLDVLVGDVVLQIDEGLAAGAA